MQESKGHCSVAVCIYGQ